MRLSTEAVRDSSAKAVIRMPAPIDQLELADARIVLCAWCDGRSFTNPCHICAARLAESGTQNRSAS